MQIAPENGQRFSHKSEDDFGGSLLGVLTAIIMAAGLLIYALFKINSSTDVIAFLSKKSHNSAKPITGRTDLKNITKTDYWIAPDLEILEESELKNLILYGKELIVHTSRYLGPGGSVAKFTNGMNCQNCHLDAGTRIFGNNYGSVASTYPKFRARSGSIEDIYKRVNDCVERSLNGSSGLDTLSREMQAIKAYIEFLGKDIKKGESAKGSGLKELAYLDRPADPVRGYKIYVEKCQLCHQKDGEGLMSGEAPEYVYPPLWGKNAYNDAAGLFRISNFAKYVKYNMPLGASYTSPQLTDEESWDIAAFINSQPRPHKHIPGDWPDITKKPVDHPFGPFDDGFSEKDHKYGPFKPIIATRESKNKT